MGVVAVEAEGAQARGGLLEVLGFLHGLGRLSLTGGFAGLGFGFIARAVMGVNSMTSELSAGAAARPAFRISRPSRSVGFASVRLGLGAPAFRAHGRHRRVDLCLVGEAFLVEVAPVDLGLAAAMVGAGGVFLGAELERVVDLVRRQVGDGGVELGLVVERSAGGGGLAQQLLKRLDLAEREVDGVEVADELGLVVGVLGEGGGEGLGDGDRQGALTFPPPWAAPFLSRGRERRVSDAGEARGGGVEVGLAVAAAVGGLGVHAEAEHQQAVVGLAAVADELAEAHHGDELALDRAFKGEVAEALDAEVEGGFPRAAEAFGAGLAAEVVGALGAHVDLGRGAGDAAGVGESGDEGALALGGPAVVAIFAGDGLEVGERLGAPRGGAVLHGAPS